MVIEAEIEAQLHRIADALEGNAQLCREDLDFRREQAAKADAEKEIFMKSFFGGLKPNLESAMNPPAPIAGESRRRSRHRHEHPEPPEAA